MITVVDDSLLVLTLAGALAIHDVATTPTWWFRAARARARAAGGALDRLVESVDPETRRLVDRGLERLPDHILVLEARTLVPAAAATSASLELNVLAAEALATAMLVGGRLAVAAHDQSPRLRAAAEHAGVAVEVIEV